VNALFLYEARRDEGYPLMISNFSSQYFSRILIELISRLILIIIDFFGESSEYPTSFIRTAMYTLWALLGSGELSPSIKHNIKYANYDCNHSKYINKSIFPK
jgi:hypothetical protein